MSMRVARWHTGTKAQTLAFLREYKRPDIANILNPMAKVEAEEKVQQWDVACLECRICEARQVAVLPSDIQVESQECHVCGNITADVVEID